MGNPPYAEIHEILDHLPARATRVERQSAFRPTMTSVFIDGEAGTTGLGIRQRLAGLPVTAMSIAPEHRKDTGARQAMMAQADVVVLCLPDTAAHEAVALANELGAAAPRLLDASSPSSAPPSPRASPRLAA